MNSLRARLMFSASVVLAVFIVLAGYTLDRAFYTSAESGLQEYLSTQLTFLLASTEVNNVDDVDMPARLLESKFNLPGSGLYGMIVNSKGQVVWKSLSTFRVNIPQPMLLPAGTQKLTKMELADEEFYLKSYGINWFTDKAQVPLTFNVISDLATFHQQIRDYRRTLWGWLICLAVILLLVQTLILVWGLKPLGRVVMELNAIESGQQDRLAQSYPREIVRLTDNINGLLEHEHTQQTRYRQALADLAHSLKTPLAVISAGLAEMQPEKSRDMLNEQLQRMNHIIGHQLHRAATAGTSPIRKSIALEPLVNKLMQALAKVYQDKKIHFDYQIPTDLKLRVDEGDMMEVLGNIMDNACKWCRQRVEVSCTLHKGRARLTIADDGPGIVPSQVELMLQRGGRLDQAVPGQGLGLSVVVDIVEAYHSRLAVTSSALGGAAFAMDLPASE